MTDPGSKKQLLETMQAERARWQGLLAAIDPQRMEGAGTAGPWPVKDVLAHIGAYERWLVDWLEAARQGQFPPSPILDPDDIDLPGTLPPGTAPPRPLADILAEEEHVYQSLIEILGGLSEAELFDPERTDWFVRPYWGEGTALWEAVAGLTYDHYREHSPGLQAYIDEISAG